MSGPDEADRDKGFLARWSQRKQEAKQPEPTQDAAGCAKPSNRQARPHRKAKTSRRNSISRSLPKLEELTGSTDITAFLRKGVPEHLRNAALRKSWALDPAIRNYVNPALEYAYDWNTPGGVPGGGELGAGVDVARLVSQIMGEPAAETTSSGASSADEAPHSPVEPSERDLPAKPQVDLPVQSLRRSVNRRRKRKSFQRPTAMPANPRRPTNPSQRGLLRRNNQCDVMAPQNRLFRQKFLRT